MHGIIMMNANYGTPWLQPGSTAATTAMAS
jgi:hypothetical protein